MTLLIIFSAFVATAKDPLKTFPPMGVVYHPVSTTNLDAQQAFNRGLMAMYAFNHIEAYDSFKKASQTDPKLAMAYWGMALSLGENINTPITTEKEKEAFALMKKALALSENATEEEKAYIKALATRYSNDPNPDRQRLREAYAKEMKKLVADYPDDLDGATLCAESLMDLHPWQLWTHDGKPEEGTIEVLKLLESILKRDPMHVGANHYYIHAVEASKNPERALMSAYRLYLRFPEWGHLLHMPSHIFILVGDYENAAIANVQAVEADKSYIKNHGLNFYPLHYMSHNLFFLCRAYLWQDNYEKSLAVAQELEEFLSPNIDRMPDLEYYLLAPLQVYSYFHKWEEILDLPQPPSQLKGLTAFWHFSRSMAFIAQGDFESAEKEKTQFLNQKNAIPNKQRLGYNQAGQVLDVAEQLLEASFAKGKGDEALSIQYLKKAVEKQDLLNYNEPPDWYYPVRQTLGAALIKMHQYQESETIFREALDRLPRNGRSLFGLLQSLKKQNKSHYWVEREMMEALRNFDHTLKLEDL